MGRYGKKLAAMGVAAGLAAATLLGGTLAWQSVSQGATNEVNAAVNPGGRLHDDFNGVNKDVYVENFTVAEGGSGMPIFARIRLYEYMETGADAGINRDSDSRDVQVVTTTANPDPDIQNPSTWMVHPYDHETNPATGETSPVHNYVRWQMGGSTVYMPTFNMNPDSLEADINGTFAGPDQVLPGVEGDSGDKYQDYETYTPGETKVDTEVYSDDGSSDVPGKTHIAQATQTAKVMSMAEWKKLGSPVGNFWVYDTDGWAYWAEPILPGTATGLLLDGLNYRGTPAEDWYYAIHVEAQMASAFDWGSQDTGDGFYTDGETPTKDALDLLNQAAKVVVDADGKLYVDCGSNTYRPVVDNAPYLGDLVCAGMDKTVGSEDDRHDVVEVGEGNDQNFGDKLLGPDEDGYYQAAGPDDLLGTEDDILVTDATPGDGNSLDKLEKVQLTVTITPRIGTELGTGLKAKPGDEVPFGAKVMVGKKEISMEEVSWTVTGDHVAAGTTIDHGQLTIDAAQGNSSTLTVTASYKNASDSVTLTITNDTLDYDDIHSVVPGATTPVFIDKHEWYVLVKDDINDDMNTEALLWATDVLGYDYSSGEESNIVAQTFGSSIGWENSNPQNYLNSTWLASTSVLQEAVVATTISTRMYNELEWATTNDSVFCLSEADLFGTFNGEQTTYSGDYTYGKEQLVPNSNVRRNDKTTFTTFTRNILPDQQVSTLRYDGGKSSYSKGTLLRYRPALWVTFSKTGA